jgi:hypothetical protein
LLPFNCATLYVSFSVCRIENDVPAPRSVARPTRTGRSAFIAFLRLNRPLPRNWFDVGQCAIAVPVSWQRCSSSSVSQMPCP